MRRFRKAERYSTSAPNWMFLRMVRIAWMVLLVTLAGIDHDSELRVGPLAQIDGHQDDAGAVTQDGKAIDMAFQEGVEV